MDSNPQRDKNSMKKHEWQLNNENNNPCFKEHTMSLKCIDDNNYELELCQLQFENYKNCKKFWSEVTRNRKRNGVKPYLPPLEERKEIKEKYFETGKI